MGTLTYFINGYQIFIVHSYFRDSSFFSVHFQEYTSMHFLKRTSMHFREHTSKDFQQRSSMHSNLI